MIRRLKDANQAGCPLGHTSDRTAVFSPHGINDNGVVAGDTQGAAVGYWNSNHSSHFVEINLSGLMFADGKSISGAYIAGIENNGDAVGYAWSSVGEQAALEIPGKGGLPVGKPKLITHLGSAKILGISAINPPYILAVVTDTGKWGNHFILYNQTTGAVTNTDLSEHHEGGESFRDLTNTGSVAWVNNSALRPVVRKINGTEISLGPANDDLYSPSINDSGYVSGSLVSDSPLTTTPTLWSPTGSPTILNSLAAVQAKGLTITTVVALNDSNEMIGVGTIGSSWHAFLLGFPKVTLSGTLRITDCGDNSCLRSGAKGEKVNVVKSGSTSSKTTVTTASDGSWSAKVSPGTYTVTPPDGFLPSSKIVNAKASQSGIDFAVCGSLSGATNTVRTRRDAASGQSACPDSVTWKMENRTILASVDGAQNSLGLTNKSTIYAPYTVSLFLTVGGTPISACSSSSSWKWTIASKPAGSVVSQSPTPGCTPFMQVSKQGNYKLVAKRYEKTRLRQTITRTVKVHDLLILAMGDSNGSGEGDPPFYFGQCNRSTGSYQYQAANMLQTQSQLRTSVTLVSASCSGAQIRHLINTNYDGINPSSPLPPQIAQLRGEIAPPSGHTKRTVDGVIISIGVNDIAFGPILQYCIKYGYGRFGPHTLPCEDSHVRATLDSKGAITGFVKDNSSPKTLSDTIDRLVKTLPGQYARLATALSSAGFVSPSKVYITQYPSFFYGNGSTLCTATNSGVSGFNRSTWHWLEGEAADLNTQVIRAARSEAWTVVPVPASLFYGHGYCSGDPWFIGIATAGANSNIAGAFHPSERGAHVSGTLVLKKMCDLLNDAAACKSFPTP